VAVEGPSQAKIEMTDNPNGYTMVSYVVTKEGNDVICGIPCESIIPLMHKVAKMTKNGNVE